jgi:hypothetical protein
LYGCRVNLAVHELYCLFEEELFSTRRVMRGHLFHGLSS